MIPQSYTPEGRRALPTPTLRMAARLLAADPDAADALVIECLDAAEGDTGHPETPGLIVAYLRQLSARMPATLPTEESSPTDLPGAVRALPSPLRTICVARMLLGLSVEETAAALGLPAEDVYAGAGQVLKHLRPVANTAAMVQDGLLAAASALPAMPHAHLPRPATPSRPNTLSLPQLLRTLLAVGGGALLLVFSLVLYWYFHVTPLIAAERQAGVWFGDPVRDIMYGQCVNCGDEGYLRLVRVDQKAPSYRFGLCRKRSCRTSFQNNQIVGFRRKGLRLEPDAEHRATAVIQRLQNQMDIYAPGIISSFGMGAFPSLAPFPQRYRVPAVFYRINSQLYGFWPASAQADEIDTSLFRPDGEFRFTPRCLHCSQPIRVNVICAQHYGERPRPSGQSTGAGLALSNEQTRQSHQQFQRLEQRLYAQHTSSTHCVVCQAPWRRVPGERRFDVKFQKGARAFLDERTPGKLWFICGSPQCSEYYAKVLGHGYTTHTLHVVDGHVERIERRRVLHGKGKDARPSCINNYYPNAIAHAPFASYTHSGPYANGTPAAKRPPYCLVCHRKDPEMLLGVAPGQAMQRFGLCRNLTCRYIFQNEMEPRIANGRYAVRNGHLISPQEFIHDGATWGFEGDCVICGKHWKRLMLYRWEDAYRAVGVCPDSPVCQLGYIEERSGTQARFN